MDVNALIGMGHGMTVAKAISRFCAGKNCGNCEGVAFTADGRLMPTDCACDCHTPEDEVWE